jgi:hypothetical protein
VSGTPHAPKHRAAKHKAAPKTPVRNALRSGAKNVTVMSGLAVAATGVAVATGVIAGGSSSPVSNAAAATAVSGKAEPLSAADLKDREAKASRSSDDRRAPADTAKAAVLSNASGVAVTTTEDLTVADPRTLARALMPAYGLSSSEFSCLDYIWTQESNWNVHADNPSSSAYGIPQALPGSKMASAGDNWENSAETQIRWGLGYIKKRYGTACNAAGFKHRAGWY